VHYMYFAMLLFWMTIFLAAIVALCTEPLPEYMVIIIIIISLIRTTYKTRFDKRKRNDDNQPLRAEELELMIAAQRKIVENDVVIHDGETKKMADEKCDKPSIIMRLFRWVCGVETEPEKERRIVRDNQDRIDQERDPEKELTITREAEDRLYIKKVNTLEQSDRDKKILNSSLIIIITVAIGLYAFFSINPLSQEETYNLRMEAYNRSIYSLYHSNYSS
ncbi:hypothetical protein L9F63_006278, partial [Diploptera punctata]